MGERCGFTGEELSAFVDGELAPERADALASHLENCESCAAEIAHFKKIDRLAKSSFGGDPNVPAVPPERWDGMWSSITSGLDRPAAEKTLPGHVRLTWFRSLAAAAMIAVALVLLFALPWGPQKENGGTSAGQPARVEINDYSDDYELSVETNDEAIVISMTLVPEEEG